MKCTELQFVIPEVMGPDNQPRSPGLHLSDIIRDISNTALYPGQRKPLNEQTQAQMEQAKRRFAMGFVWERTLQRSLSEEFATGACVRPGEQHLDGICGTPDLINLVDCTLEEWKATWKSSNKCDNLEDNFTEWFWQIKAYLKMLGYTTARLRTFFINGDYRDSGPQIKCWELQFTQREIDDNWSMITRHARRMENANATKGINKSSTTKP